ncbi:carbon-nitrogen hydrolase family protein [Vannielia sp. SX4]|uniref:carbon-nitrogen hydrolase family protein n=1 Tax=Vannielia sp. SX4 TaxID=3463852 RepID=UPI00405866B0
MQIALWQTRPQPGIDPALSALDEAARAAAQAGADLLVTPEMALGGYNIGAAEVAANAGRAGEVAEALSTIARRHGIALTAGLALPSPGPRPYNACLAIDATGRELARYHKVQLFGEVDAAQFTPGDALSPVFELAGWKLALAICYDIEFPELARGLALRGAELIVTPTANMVPYASVNTRLVPARAEENTTCIAYCNYVGAEGAFIYNGLSCACGADGADIARAPAAQEALLSATLDRAALAQARRAQPYLSARRADLYQGQP